MGQETDITKRIQKALSMLRRGIVTFRNNTGMGYQGKTERGMHGAIIIRDPRVLQAGLHEGSSDLIGWRTVTVSPEMVGSRLAVFTAIEVKTPGGRTSKEQKTFIASVQAAGGIAGVVESEEEAAALFA